MNIFPSIAIGNDEIIEGKLIASPEYCKKNFNAGTASDNQCKNFYQNLLNKPTGLYICPKGFNVYVAHDTNNQSYSIFSCFRVQNEHDQKSTKRLLKPTERNLLLTKEEFKNLMKVQIGYIDLHNLSESLKLYIRGSLHDVRKFNSQIKSISEEIHMKTRDHSKKNSGAVKKIDDLSRSLWSYSSMITTRLETMSYVEDATNSPKTVFNLHRTMTKIVCGMKRNEKNIVFNLECNSDCPDILAPASLEILGILLIENAYKYAPNAKYVNTKIIDERDKQKLIISNIGPKVHQDEISKLTHFGFRGSGAQQSNEGTGIGLFTAKQICNQDGLEIDFECGRETQNIEGIDYSKFIVKVSIPKEL